MKKVSIGFVLLLISLISCSPAQIESVPAPTASALPATPVSATPTLEPTAEQTLPTLSPNIQEAHLEKLQMMDETSGWAWAADRADKTYLLHTLDGGLTWKDATPEKDLLFGSYSAFMLDSQTAWVVLRDESLARTSDGGQTWNVINQNLKNELTWPFRDWYRLRFADAQRGWLVAGYTAAGAHEIYYVTRDGGITWDPADFKTLPGPYRSENAGSEIAFWVDTDVIYYDLERFILAPGDQEGTLEMFLSTDWGDSWKTVPLPSSLPDQPFNVYDRKIHSPVFFNSQNGVLAVTIRDSEANVTRLSIYGTSNGGLTWSLRGGPATLADTIVEPGSEVLFLSPRDAVLHCGTGLCVTHDSGNHWQTFSFGISMPANPAYTIFQLDFIDLETGWLLLSIYDDHWHSRLLRTNDSGATWRELSSVINP